MKVKITHKGFYFCQHCGLQTTECKKMYKQTGDLCCAGCKEEVTGTKIKK